MDDRKMKFKLLLLQNRRSTLIQCEKELWIPSRWIVLVTSDHQGINCIIKGPIHFLWLLTKAIHWTHPKKIIRKYTGNILLIYEPIYLQCFGVFEERVSQMHFN